MCESKAAVRDGAAQAITPPPGAAATVFGRVREVVGTPPQPVAAPAEKKGEEEK